MPPRSTAKLLHSIDAKLDGARGEMQELRREVCHITKEMKVNGAVGLENILSDQHKKQKLLSSNLDAIAVVVSDTKTQMESINAENKITWAATEKLRVRFDMVQSIGRYLDAHPVVKKVATGVFGKLVKAAVIVIVGLMLASVGLDGIWRLADKIQDFLK